MVLSPTAANLEEIISAYESAARLGPAELADFLPPSESAVYPMALRELIRVDMELHWSGGRPRRVEDYLIRFPELRDDADALSEICFEEYRLRQSAGEHVDATVYGKLFHVDTKQWPIDHPVNDELVQRATAYLRDSTLKAVNGGNAAATADDPTRLFMELHESNQPAARALAEALTSFPSVGESFLGFDLVDELGRGAFSRVFLAQERAVDGRRVALKITGDMRSEVRALARLRHTNIVPVYSVKDAGPLHAVCMPYCGSVTLAQVIRRVHEEKQLPRRGRTMTGMVERQAPSASAPLLKQIETLSYVDAVLTLAARLADGLAHAHERGICHRDIKPANVLLANDGEPLLLDFNLATELRSTGTATAAFIGGTLPYMAPEQLRAFRHQGPAASFASDVYSLGLVLYEWLTGQLPNAMPAGNVDAIVDRLIVERSTLPADVRQANSDVSPSFAAIIAKCLHPNAARRYPTARELAEDLALQRDHQPLRHAIEPSWRERTQKWAKRHPRLSSGASISILASTAIIGLGLATLSIHRDRTALAERENRREFMEDYRTAKLALAHPNPNPDTLRRGMAAASSAWKRIPEASADLKTERGTLAWLLAQTNGRQVDREPTQRKSQIAEAENWNRLARSLLGPESSLAIQQANWLQQLESGQGKTSDAPELASTDDLEMGLWLLNRQPRRALEHLMAATRHDSDSTQAWWLRGLAEQMLGRKAAAHASFSTCLALDRRLPDAYHARAVVAMELGHYKEAIDDLTKTLEFDADSINATLDRGICKLELGDINGADADVTYAIDHGYPETRLYFIRARIRQRMGKTEAANADRKTGTEREPFSEADWSARAMARLPAHPKDALADLDQCVVRYPKSSVAWQNRAYICDAFLKDEAQAIQALNEAIQLEPENAAIWASRGVLNARKRDYAAARSDAVQALTIVRGQSTGLILEERPDVIYQIAGIYALTAQDRPTDNETCLFLLNRALQSGYGIELVEIDPELRSVRQLPEVKRMVAAAKKWKNRGGLGGTSD